MKIKAASRITQLPEYAFKVIDDQVQALRQSGANPIDFGVGDPSTPTPEAIRNRCKLAIDERAKAGYPSYIGASEFREAVARWTSRRFGVELNPETEVSTTVGSKEGVFNFHKGFVDPGDLVLVPSPGYPPYSRGAWFAEGKTWFYPLLEENDFLPDLKRIPDEVARNAKIMWVNYPNSPTGTCVTTEFLEKLHRWTSEREIILAVDEAYSEIYYETPPPSVLQIAKDGVISFNSLSKCSAMTTYRIGWVAGDPRIIEIFRKTKTNIDSGAPTFIQDAGVEALENPGHMVLMRNEYREKRDLLVRALNNAGLVDCTPSGTVFVWQKTPEGMTDLELATRLLSPELALVAIPGSLISETTADGLNPGRGHLRFSLTPPLSDIREAAKRLEGITLT